jgi:hypothetical protein
MIHIDVKGDDRRIRFPYCAGSFRCSGMGLAAVLQEERTEAFIVAVHVAADQKLEDTRMFEKNPIAVSA